MAKSTRAFPPKAVGRFNYWQYFAPQRIVSTPRLAAHEHNRRDFHLLLTASREEWNQEILPRYHLQYDEVENHPLYALTGYVEDDKEWSEDPEAQQVLKQLSPQQREAIHRLDRAKWPERSKRPARIKRTWKALCREIAHDQETFERFCKKPPAPDTLKGTEARIYKSYSQRAIKLLGAIFIDKPRRHIYRDLLDGSSLLTPSGWIRCESIFEVNWLDLTRKERRAAKKRTLHWFHHALRNLREYRYHRPAIPWTAECENTCCEMQKKTPQFLILRTPLILGTPHQS